MTHLTTDRLETLAQELACELEQATAAEIIQCANETFGDRFAITASMADALLTRVASRAAPGVRVLFLDTGYHFAETIGTRDAVAETYDVKIETISNPLPVEEHESKYGRLYESNPDFCCTIRKVWPLDQALRCYDAWASGLRRTESPSRANTPVVGWDVRRKKIKINPLAKWTDEDVDAYIRAHRILVNPLREIGYTSIGCAPCTRPVAENEHPRAGRWSDFTKTECGIH